MRQVLIKDLSEYIDEVNVSDIFYKHVVFRGQPVRGNLIPSIARTKPTVDSTAQEKELLRQLRLMGASHIKIPDAHALELLVLAQHSGLKTRLLDWTSNPLAALWFASTDPKENDVFVYELNAGDLLTEDPYSQDPFAIKQTTAFQPRLNNPRIIAQHGWFTLHKYAETQGRFVSLEKAAKVKDKLTEYRIPANSKKSLLGILDRHGINRKTLFPDLEGLCLHLNWKHPVR
jgi:hypothetical protein